MTHTHEGDDGADLTLVIGAGKTGSRMATGVSHVEVREVAR